jgi:hypothetical protein
MRSESLPLRGRSLFADGAEPTGDFTSTSMDDDDEDDDGDDDDDDDGGTVEM